MTFIYSGNVIPASKQLKKKRRKKEVFPLAFL
jgi:hypothetical protein